MNASKVERKYTYMDAARYLLGDAADSIKADTGPHWLNVAVATKLSTLAESDRNPITDFAAAWLRWNGGKITEAQYRMTWQPLRDYIEEHPELLPARLKVDQPPRQ